MARMIPSIVESSDFNGSSGEEMLFSILRNLPAEYTVFHSVKWNRKDRRGNVRWGESDYTVFCPQHGLLVIEVKSGKITCDGTGIILQTNTNTLQSCRISPMEQATRSKHAFRELLDAAVPEDEVFWIESAVWFTSIRRGTIRGNLPPSYREENTFFEDDLTDPLSAIERAYSFYNMREMRHSDAAVSAVINTLIPCFEAIPSLSSIYVEQEFCFNRMTNEQSYLLDYLDEQKVAVIQGAAGTGKTMLAIEKARRLSEHEQVLFLCFNRMLLSHLKKTFGDTLPNVGFFNLQGMASSALNKEASAEDVTGFLNNYDHYFDGWKFCSIIIDEGQDFEEKHIQLLKDIAVLQEGSFYVFYDKHQLVQQRNSLEWVRDVECRLVLSMNCRNTRNIAETSGFPLSITNIRMRQEVLGIKPCFYIAQTKQDAIIKISLLIRNYIQNGLTQKQIVILTTKTIETSILSGMTSVGSYRLKHADENRGILFTTAKKYKGLEADTVIMIDISQESFSNDEQRRVYYVGTSRAKHVLDFVAVLPEGQEKTLANSILGRECRNARMSIMSGLKVKVRTEVGQHVIPALPL